MNRSTTITGSRPRYTKPSAAKFFATFGYAWLTIGLFTGTLVLVLAVRGIMSIVQRLDLGRAAQNQLLIAVIVVFIVLSFMLARRVVRMLYHKAPFTRRVALVALAIPALLSVYAWSNPTRFLAGIAGTTGSMYAIENGPTFLFGPSTSGLQAAAGFERRTERFERGMPMRMQEGAWVVPLLNEAEFYGFVLQGHAGHLLMVLDSSNAEQHAWLLDARKRLGQYAVQYELLQYPGAKRDTSTVAVVARIRTLKPPFTVMVPSMMDKLGDLKDPIARAIAKAYGTSVKQLPKTIKLAPGETLMKAAVNAVSKGSD